MRPSRLRALISGTTELIDFRRLRFRDRGRLRRDVDQEASVRRSGEARLPIAVSSPPTPRRCRSQRWPLILIILSGSSGSTSSIRWRSCHWSRSFERPATDEDTLATAVEPAKTLKKNAVLVKDATGFVVNRLLLRLMGEIFASRRRGHPCVRRRCRACDHSACRWRRTCCFSWSVRPLRCTLSRTCTQRSAIASPSRLICGPWSPPDAPASTTGPPDGEPYVSDETAALFEIGDRAKHR